jgi:hypothetical protein
MSRIDLANDVVRLIASVLPPDHDPADVNRAAEDILSRPEFQQAGPTRIERAWSWIGDQIAKVFSLLGDGVPGTLFGALILGAALAGIGVLVWRVVRSWPGRRRRVPVPTATVVIDGRVSAVEWRRLASVAASEGRWRESLRCRYRAMVSELDDGDLLTEVPGSTTGEERVEIARTAPGASGDFASATAMFDGVWYGGEDADASDVERFAGHEREIAEKTR